MRELQFNDAFICFGRPQYKKELHLESVFGEMDCEGISSAVAIAYEQFYAPPDMSNEIAMKAAENERLYRVVTMASSVNGELCEPVKYLDEKTAGFLLSPAPLHVPARPVFLKEWLSYAEEHSVPVWHVVSQDTGFEYAADVLAAFPKLRMILFHNETWPNSRKTFPLFAEYPNLYAGSDDFVFMGAIELFVRRFGAKRMLYSSRYPGKYTCAAKLALLSADISDEDKADIAGENLLELLGGIVRG